VAGESDTGLKAIMERLEAAKEAQDFDEALEAWEKLGLTSEEITEKLGKYDVIERERIEKEGTWDEKIASIEDRAKKDLERQAAKHAQAVIELEEKLRQERAFTDKLLINDGLKDELLLANVNERLLRGALAILRPKAEVKEDGDDRVAILVEDKIEYSIKDAVARWADSEEGKSYFLAPDTEGGGGAEGKRQRAGGAANPWHPDTFNMTEQALISKKDEKLAKRLQIDGEAVRKQRSQQKARASA
jgi:hypothetical protein